MRITFLGTGAANGYPEAFCQCANCERARALGGPSLRKRSAALLNADLLLDLGPDVPVAAWLHQQPLTRVQHCLLTHAHADHLDTSLLLSRSPEYGVANAPCLHLYASPGSLAHAARLLERDCAPEGLLDPQVGARLNLRVHTIEALRPFAAGPYQVTAFPANHDPAMDPLLFAIEASGRRLFYGTYTASLPETTWQALQDYGLPFDILILDHTYGPYETGADHLNAWQFIAHVDRLRAAGLLHARSRIFATHISHPGNPVHPELAVFAARHGYEVAFDGLVVEQGT